MTAIPSLCPLPQGMGSKGWHSSPESEPLRQGMGWVRTCPQLQDLQRHLAALFTPLTQQQVRRALVQMMTWRQKGPLLLGRRQQAPLRQHRHPKRVGKIITADRVLMQCKSSC